MDLDTVTTLLIAIAPAVSAVLTIVGGFVAITKQSKKKVSAVEEEARQKVSQTQKDISVIKSKLASIENILADEKERH